MRRDSAPSDTAVTYDESSIAVRKRRFMSVRRIWRIPGNDTILFWDTGEHPCPVNTAGIPSEAAATVSIPHEVGTWVCKSSY